MPTRPRSRTTDVFEPAGPPSRASTTKKRTPAGAHATKASAPAPFAGFGADGTEFFRALDEEQTREWFHAHKDEYTRLWLAPMQSLFGHLARSLTEVYPAIGEGIPKVFRIQRDLRFTNDRTPYKTCIAASVGIRAPRRGEGEVPGVYVQLGLENLAGGGRWMLDGDALARFRTAIAHAKHGAALTDALAPLLADGFTVGAHDALKRVPAPYASDHPRGELLKRKGLAVMLPPVPDSLVHDPALADWLVAHFRRLAPVLHWLDRHTA